MTDEAGRISVQGERGHAGRVQKAPRGGLARDARRAAPDGLLFGYFEAEESFQASLDGMDKEAINAKWQDSMAPFFEGTGDHADEMMVELEEVFHLD